MPIDISHIDLATVNFNSLSREALRAIAIAKSIRPEEPWSTRTVAPSRGTKDELIKALDRTRRAGLFHTDQKTPTNADPRVLTNSKLTVKATNVIIILEGKGCGESGRYYLGAEGYKDGRVRLANLERESGEDVYGEDVYDLDDYENFWTTVSDLRDLLDALEAHAN